MRDFLDQCGGLNRDIPPIGSDVWTLGPHLVVLFGGFRRYGFYVLKALRA